MTLIGFKDLEAITPKFEHFHEAFKWGELILGKRGACWRVYTKEGYQLRVRPSHSLELGAFGQLKSTLGASEEEYDIMDLMEEYKGIKNLIHHMIKERNCI